MKKMNCSVTMPLIDFEQLQNYKTNYDKLVSELKDCFDTGRFSIDGTIRFDDNKALKIAEKFLNIKYKKAIINK